MGGYCLAHAMMMLIPEAWAGNPLMDEERRAFYEYHCAADGAVGRPGRRGLYRRPPDRRHARPQRPASGALSGHRRRSRGDGLGDGRAADSRRSRSSRSGACSRARCSSSTSSRAASSTTRNSSSTMATAKPYRQWIEESRLLRRRPARSQGPGQAASRALLDAQQAFGYTQEDFKFILEPMAHERRGGHRLHGQRQPAAGAVGQEQAAVSTTSSNCSPR